MRYLAFILLIVAYVSPAFAGGSSCDKKACDKSSSCFKGIGCDCHSSQTLADQRNILHLLDREDADSAELYCYKPEFEISSSWSWEQLINAANDHYQSNGTSKECDTSNDHQCPSSVADLLDSTPGKYSKCDCLGNLNFRTICESSICQVCKNNNDCKRLGAISSDWDNTKDSATCMTPIFGANKYEKKIRTCGYCNHIDGNGWKKITLVLRGVSNAEQTAKSIISSLKSFEPFNYLFNQGAFTFQYASFPFASYVSYQLVEEPAGSGKLKYSSTTEALITTAAKNVCTNTDVVIFIDQNFPVTGIGAYTRPDGNIYSAPYPATIAHELGHSICGLGDEYYIPDNERFIASTMHGMNENAKNIDRYECNKFKSVDSNLPCIAIASTQGEGGSYKKSSSQSLMNNDNVGFNLMSCIGCLEKLSDTTSNSQRAAICRGLNGVIKP
jgi:hypothetical protein